MVKIGIVGGTGYTGVELLRILASHPEADVRAITSRGEAGTRVVGHVPEPARQVRQARVHAPRRDRTCSRATSCSSPRPHGVAMAQARELVNAGVKIIDLAADFRIRDPKVFEKWYKLRTLAPTCSRSRCTAARVPSRAIASAPHRRQSRLLSDGDAARPHSAARGGDRRQRASHRRLQSRAHRARAQGGGRLLLAEASDNFKAYGVPAIAIIPRRAGAAGRSKTPVGSSSRRISCR
jgi:N-acetyl-gamma-glutamyl-phosphate reductase